MNLKLITLIALVVILSSTNLIAIYYDLQITFFIVSLIILLAIFAIFYYLKWYKLNDRNLFSQPLFICSILIPFYYFFLFGCWAWKGHSLDLTSDGFTNFLSISKLPLVILASSVPLASIINNIHRTIQTESQIQASSVKNKADAYYSHLKLFIETINSYPTLVLEYIPTQTDRTRHVPAEVISHAYIESKDTLITYEMRIAFPHKLYNDLFNASQVSGAKYNPSEEFTNKIISAWNDLDKEILNIKKGNLKLEVESLISIDLMIISLLNLLKINPIRRKYSYLVNYKNKYVFNTTYFSEPEIKAVVYWLYKTTSDIYDLAGNSQLFEGKHLRLLKYLQSAERRFSKITFQQTNEVYAKAPYIKIFNSK